MAVTVFCLTELSGWAHLGSGPGKASQLHTERTDGVRGAAESSSTASKSSPSTSSSTSPSTSTPSARAAVTLGASLDLLHDALAGLEDLDIPNNITVWEAERGSLEEIPPLAQVLLVFLQSSLDVDLTLHLNEGLASWKTTVVQTEIDPCMSFDDLGLNKSLVHPHH